MAGDVLWMEWKELTWSVHGTRGVGRHLHTASLSGAPWSTAHSKSAPSALRHGCPTKHLIQPREDPTQSVGHRVRHWGGAQNSCEAQTGQDLARWATAKTPGGEKSLAMPQQASVPGVQSPGSAQCWARTGLHESAVCSTPGPFRGNPRQTEQGTMAEGNSGHRK